VKPPRTNAVRMLDGLGIPYELREYEADPNDLAAETVAAKIGMPAEQVFKTLAVRGDRSGVLLAVIPGNAELDFKALAQASGDRKTEMVPLKEVQAVTGYIRGAVTALACKKEYPVYIDETAELFDVISVSAGMRGLQILLAPGDYIRAVNAQIASIAKGKAPERR
jgi:Cys-tRNA(Pro)/Cys-tRNA(Cys) deacylase